MCHVQRRTLWLVSSLCLVVIASVWAAHTVLAADPAVPPIPNPAPASPNLLPPYAVWQQEPVEGVPPVHSFDLAIGEDGAMHIVAAEAETGALTYRVGRPGAWLTSTVEISTSAHFIAPAIVLDHDGRPQIAYVAVYSSPACEVGPFLGVFHAERQGANWVVSDVARPEKLNSGTECGIGSIGWGASIAIDGDGEPWVSWEEGYIGSPSSYWSGRVAQRVAGAWLRIPLGTMPLGKDVHDIRLAVDPNGDIHAAYNHYSTPDKGASENEMLHTVWQGGQAWTSRVAGISGPLDIAIDPLGRGFIGLTETTLLGMELQVARDLGAGWVREIVDGRTFGRRAVGMPRIAIGGDGLPAVTALAGDLSGVEFRFVWWDGFFWRSEGTSVTSVYAAGYDMAFDRGTPVIAFADEPTRTLRLATRVPVEIEPRAQLPLIAR